MRKLLIAAVTLAAATAGAATFVVPSDRDMVRRSDAIVIGSALDSYAQKTADGGVETVTPFSVESVIKGAELHEVINVVEPGGTIDGVSVSIPGVPRFEPGKRVLIFLKHIGDERWAVAELILGKFRFESDTSGEELLLRDTQQVAAFDSDFRPHREPLRAARAFLDFIHGEVSGAAASDNYIASGRSATSVLRITPNLVFTATSYTMTVSGTFGARWNTFPNPVTFYAGASGEPGAPGNGVTAVQTALAAWTNDPNSNVNYVYGGTDSTHTSGLHSADGVNTVLFEQDLSAWGIAPFTCSSNGYSGTLGLGGITSASGQHTLNGETFFTTQEGDVEMNQGLANCTLLFSSGDFNTAVTHEIGHTLGFRHSDQTRDSSAACTTDPTLECSNQAVMKSFISTGINAALQPWDQHAVDAVYPGTGVTIPAAPSGVVATATSANSVSVSWNLVVGATSYQIFRRGPGGSFAQIGTATTNSFADTSVAANTSYLYKVRAVNAAGSSGDSNIDLATTVIFTDDPLQPGVTIIKAVHLAELRTAVNAVQALAGQTAATFTDPASPGIVIKAVHITELRAALDPALSALALPSGGYTNSIGAGSIIQAVDFQEIRNRVK